MRCPEISIVVPVYNMAGSLRRAIDSILNQNFKNYEIVIVDDGSTDLSGKICDNYAERHDYIRVIHKPNGGLSSARNAGISEARGKWVTFCDSDDYVFQDWLSNFKLEEIGNNSIDLICQGIKTSSGIDGVNIGEHHYGVDFIADAKDALSILLKNQLVGYTVIKAYKREIIIKYHLAFNESLYLREDEEFLLRYLRYCKTVIGFSKCGYYYFVPQWKNKYLVPINNTELLEKSFRQSLIDLGVSKNSEVWRWYREDRISALIECFYHNKKERNYCLSRLRDIFRDEFAKCQLTFLTKAIIALDTTNIISKKALICHLKLRKLIKYKFHD